ncbi:hypothetical protein LSCM4_04728 [Leishmania orientalis]|uniref:BAR domain-containing protein n=1 Tax=Leishmania orientalis TaxID=2249476 RepID=A0A836HKI0_9TRYP|nr:hypothetical protein LSCM4_04728 [Leishmania orientalis]
MGNKVSIISNSKGDDTATGAELQYRHGVLKRLNASCKELKKSVANAVMHMESTPQHLRGVGTGYLNLCACLKHGGGSGGSTHSRRQAEGSERVAFSRSIVDCQLANESYIGFQSFCDAMDDLKAGACAKFRAEIHEKLTKELGKMLADTKRALALGKKAKGSMSRFSNAAKLVSRQESAAASQGKNLSAKRSYTKAVSDRNAKEKEFTAALEVFDQHYEEVMAAAQEFCGSTTDVFLDSVVACYREIITMLDVVDTPQWSRFRSEERDMVLHQMPGVGFSESAARNQNDNKSSVTTEPKRLD